MSLSAGDRIGPYRIVSMLGAGGMGEVWRAQDERLSREVAIKILPPDVANDPARRARFEQEAKALGALNHPNIMAVYDAGHDAGHTYIVSELVDGELLRAMIDRGPLPARKAIELGVQMADALAAAHELGIVHRDFKPENVMVTRSGRLKVLDFGLAKQNVAQPGVDKTATLALSQPGMVMGTAGYMSPEQVRGEPVDARSDIFSFGCVLHELLTGKRAFSAGTAVETMSAILNQEPPELEGTTAAVPPALATIVRRCLEKRPEQRFQSAADLSFALRAITTATSSGSGVHAPIQASGGRRRWFWPAAIVAGLALFAAGFFVQRWMHRPTIQRFQRITFHKGFIGRAFFAPDGNVVYSASWEGARSRIFLAVPGSPDSRDLGLPPGSRLLAVSSKQEIAYADDSDNLMRGSLSGGQTRPLVDGVAAADWSPDGSSLAILRHVPGKYRIEYPIGTVIAEDVRFPLGVIRISPDGSRVAFVSFVEGRRVGLSVVDRAGKRKLLAVVSGQTASNSPKPLCWTPKGDEIWFASYDSSDTQTIYAVDLKGNRRVVSNVPANAELHDISHDGRALVSTGAMRWGILGAGPGQTEERDLSCLDGGIVMGISDDGRLIAATVVGDSGGPKGSVYVRSTDGSPPVRLGDGEAHRLSPDGKWVAGYVPADDGSRKFVMFPTGPGEEIPVKAPGLLVSSAWGWLPGERYLVTGRQEGKKYSCFVWDARAQTTTPVCPDGVPDSFGFFVSPDAKQVLTPAPGGGWGIYPIDGGAAQKVQGLEPNEEPIAWRADSHSVYLQPHYAGDKSTPVSILDLTTGKRTPWKEIRPSQPIDFKTDLHLHITPDGKAYAYNFSLNMSDLYVADGLR